MMKIKPGLLTVFKAYFDEKDKPILNEKITDVTAYLVKDGIKIQTLKTQASENELSWNSEYVFPPEINGEYQLLWEIGIKDQANKMIKTENITVIKDNEMYFPKTEITQKDISEIPSDIKAYLVNQK